MKYRLTRPLPRPIRSVHHNETTAARPSEALTDVLAWLAAPVPADFKDDAPQLSAQLAKLDGSPVDPVRYHRILDLFYDRAHRLSRTMKAALADSALPLARELRQFVATLVEVHGRIASGYERVLSISGETLSHNKRRNPAIVAARALNCLSEQYSASCMVAAPPPAETWRRAHRLAQIAREHFEPEATLIPGLKVDAERIYKAMIALSAAQPEGFSPGEIALAGEYLGQFSAAVEMPAPPADADGADFWIDTNRDAGPLPPSRRIPPEHGDLMRCSFQRLARLLGEQLSALEAGMPAGNLRLPENAAGLAGRAALKRLQTHWLKPPQRRFSRRHNNYRAHLCIGLTDLWQLLERGDAPEELRPGAPHTTEWMVLNESPGGLAIMHVAGEVEGLLPGSPVALRRAEDLPWSICVVRWVRSENPEHIELGLEMVAPAARSVQLLFRNGDPGQRPTPGLLLPAIPALREHAAVMAPSGVYSARRFFIVSGQEQTHVMQGRLLSLDVQTGSVELFQFEPDPYPR